MEICTGSPFIRAWMPSDWLPPVSWSAAYTSTFTFPPVAWSINSPNLRPAWAQVLVSVVEQVKFQVISGQFKSLWSSTWYADVLPVLSAPAAFAALSVKMCTRSSASSYPWFFNSLMNHSVTGSAAFLKDSTSRSSYFTTSTPFFDCQRSKISSSPARLISRS